VIEFAAGARSYVVMEAKIMGNQHPCVQKLLDMQAALGLANNSFVMIMLLDDIIITRYIF
jgi:hypothetical protein